MLTSPGSAPRLLIVTLLNAGVNASAALKSRTGSVLLTSAFTLRRRMPLFMTRRAKGGAAIRAAIRSRAPSGNTIWKLRLPAPPSTPARTPVCEMNASSVALTLATPPLTVRTGGAPTHCVLKAFNSACVP